MRPFQLRSISNSSNWLLITMLFLASCAPAAVRPLPQARHTQTHWVVAASLPLDALAFINILTADPLVGSHYSNEARQFQSNFTPQVTQAAQRLAGFRTDTLKSNLSGFLYPRFSAGAPKNLADLLHLAENPGVLRQAMIELRQQPH
jgi:hypothetical protein